MQAAGFGKCFGEEKVEVKLGRLGVAGRGFEDACCWMLVVGS
jgi:hypothetical protein